MWNKKREKDEIKWKRIEAFKNFKARVNKKNNWTM
jgi:hypothetical protein